ncbi:hypothetical protein DSO57_1017667 [Entomophthora muscae]|uniref:Uncharacterized protein n=1 Tax=Entomophthora muscae TaxID=34485 RepID=A0ACC2SHI9_9FUNG|nr:hypothetical protein DSO57_1017667 [Entomophthora muscae]
MSAIEYFEWGFCFACLTFVRVLDCGRLEDSLASLVGLANPVALDLACCWSLFLLSEVSDLWSSSMIGWLPSSDWLSWLGSFDASFHGCGLCLILGLFPWIFPVVEPHPHLLGPRLLAGGSSRRQSQVDSTLNTYLSDLKQLVEQLNVVELAARGLYDLQEEFDQERAAMAAFIAKLQAQVNKLSAPKLDVPSSPV